MLRVTATALLCLFTALAIAQSGSNAAQPGSKYEVATIMAVNPHDSAADAQTGPTSYEVSLKIKDTVWVVLYTPPRADTGVAKYAAGHQVLVLVGDKTIRYHDLLGQTLESPILRRTPVTDE